MSTNMELSKTRDFGEIISDSFLFIRENLKPLLKCFFVFCGFFLVAYLIVACIQQTKMVNLVNNITTSDPDSYGTDGITNPFSALTRQFGVTYFLTILFQLCSWTALTVTVLSYMAVYKTKGNIAPTPEEVWGYVKYYFFKIMGSIFLTLIILIIGFVCCLVPGIWLYPIMSLIFPIMIIENTGFGYAFGQSFRLIKENWWTTFGALFIMGVIVYILVAVITLPVGAANIGSMLLHPGKGVHLSQTLIIVSTVLVTICHVFYILPTVALGLCYFNLTELKDAPGLIDRINQLGNNDAANTNQPTEEY